LGGGPKGKESQDYLTGGLPDHFRDNGSADR